MLNKDYLNQIVNDTAQAVKAYQTFTNNNGIYDDESVEIKIQDPHYTAYYHSPEGTFEVNVNTDTKCLDVVCQFGSTQYRVIVTPEQTSVLGTRPVFLEAWSCFDVVFSRL